jgi:hypothetical protein
LKKSKTTLALTSETVLMRSPLLDLVGHKEL